MLLRILTDESGWKRRDARCFRLLAAVVPAGWDIALTLVPGSVASVTSASSGLRASAATAARGLTTVASCMRPDGTTAARRRIRPATD